MTRQQIIDLVSSDPSVAQASVRFIDGKPVFLTAPQLASIADRWIDVGIEELLMNDLIRRVCSTESYTLTLTTAVEYTLPDYIHRILDITRGTNGEPLTKIASVVDYNRYIFQSRVSLADTNYVIMAYALTGHGGQGELKISFAPGVSGETTLIIWYLKTRSGPPYSLDILPEDMHTVVMNFVLNHMAGKAYADVYERSRQALITQIQPIVGASSPMQHSDTMRRKNWRRSQIVSGPDSSSPYYPLPR